MIYITGDCHSDFYRFKTSIFPEQKEMTKDDYVIICGDFGGVWYSDTDNPKWSASIKRYRKDEDRKLDQLDSRPFTTLFVDGNHECFDRLYKYPVKEWHGGKVHEIRPSVLHLMRGEIFNLQGKDFFCFGGASSHDVSDGILEMNDWNTIKEWNSDPYKLFRINHISWWKEELPSEEEMDNGRKNLAAHNNKVDFIVTHSPCASTVALLGRGAYKQDVLTRYLQEIREKTAFSKWFFGHLHDDRCINNEEILLYEQIVRIL